VGDFFYRYNRGASFDDVYVVSPTFIINGRYTLTRFIYGYTPFQTGWDLAGLGFSSNFINQITKVDPKYVRLPNIAVGGIAPLSDETLDRRHNNIHESQLISQNSPDPLAAFLGLPTVRTKKTVLIKATAPALSASLRIGPAARSTTPPQHQRDRIWRVSYTACPPGQLPITDSLAEQSKRWALYFQDDWKVNRKLTLSLECDLSCRRR